MSAKISVIVPIYKAEKYLHRCVDSLLAQTIDGLEIILVYDGSPDSCGSICDEYAMKDIEREGGGYRIKVIHKENGGSSSARNAGLEIATGEYISFVDSDDMLSDANTYKILYEKAIKNSADLIIFGNKSECKNQKFIYCLPTKTKKDVLLTKKDFQHWVIKRRSKKHNKTDVVWDKIYSHDLLKGIRFNSNYDGVEDIPFNLLVYDNVERTILVNTSFYIHFYIKGSLAHGGTVFRETQERRLSVVEEHYAFIERNGLLKYKRHVDKWASGQMWHRIVGVITNCKPNDPLIEKVASAFRKEYLIYAPSLRVFIVILLFKLRQYKLLYLLYRTWHLLKQNIKKFLRR